MIMMMMIPRSKRRRITTTTTTMYRMMIILFLLLVVGGCLLVYNAAQLSNHSNKYTTKQGEEEEEHSMIAAVNLQEEEEEPKQQQQVGVGLVGILSSNKNIALRQAQRQTWVKDTLQLYPNNNNNNNNTIIHIYFLLDHETPNLVKEQELYHDIIFLNTTYSGRANKFGEKLWLWYNIAYQELYPTISTTISTSTTTTLKFVAKVDDDTLLCTNHFWPYIVHHITPKSYMGWQHTKPRIRMDEFLVILGSDLVEKLLKRRYCYDTTNDNHNNGTTTTNDNDTNDQYDYCDKNVDLYDTNYGGTSLGLWLRSTMYSPTDVLHQPLNNVTILDALPRHGRTPVMLQQWTCPQFLAVHPIKKPAEFYTLYNYNHHNST